MVTYEADLAKVVAERQELANAEKLLDLPVTLYPEVINIQKDMKGLRQIYNVYKAQKVGYGGCRLKFKIAYGDTLRIILIQVLFFFLFLHHSGCKDRVVSDLVGGFKHPATAGGC